MTSTPMQSFELDRTYRATPDQVWAAWTSAGLLEQWVVPDPEWTVSSCEVDARPGGGYRLRFGPRPQGEGFAETATFTVFEPVERLVLETLTTGHELAESSRCTVLLRPVDGGTRLDLHVEGLDGTDVSEHLLKGWELCLEGIAALLSP